MEIAKRSSRGEECLKEEGLNNFFLEHMLIKDLLPGIANGILNEGVVKVQIC